MVVAIRGCAATRNAQATRLERARRDIGEVAPVRDASTHALLPGVGRSLDCRRVQSRPAATAAGQTFTGSASCAGGRAVIGSSSQSPDTRRDGGAPCAPRTGAQPIARRERQTAAMADSSDTDHVEPSREKRKVWSGMWLATHAQCPTSSPAASDPSPWAGGVVNARHRQTADELRLRRL